MQILFILLNSLFKAGVAVNEAIEANEVRPVPIVKYCKEPPCNEEFTPCTRICSLCEERPRWPNLAKQMRAHNSKCTMISKSVKNTLFGNLTGTLPKC